MNIESLRQAFKDQQLTPEPFIKECLKTIRDDTQTSNAWIYILSDEEIEEYLTALKDKNVDDCPLWGIPFAIKDNIDLMGVPTTAACPEFAYVPKQHAFAVEQLIEAGAIPLGKTNLDQFATGLVGTRSPHGPVCNAFDKDYISGGSSSGSAYAVAKGHVSFSLGTDTAGSGRVPAGFNNIIGSKLSKGLISCSGVVPACRSLDCVTVFSLCPADAKIIAQVAAKYDEDDCYARKASFEKGLTRASFKVGVPTASQLEFFGHEEYPQLFQQACEQIQKAGGELVEVDLQAFIDAATLLYQGPWVAERYHAVGQFIQDNSHLESLDPSVAKIISGGANGSAVDAFSGFYQIQAFKKVADSVLCTVDCIVVPTAGQHYTIAQLQEKPIERNSHLGYYTNFMNLLDYCALAIPAGFTSKSLPFGITLFAPAMHDQMLLDIALKYLNVKQWGMGVSSKEMPIAAEPATNKSKGYIEVAVCGAHLKEMPLNWQLVERNAKFVESTTTASCYQFYALAGGPPARPGVIRCDKNQGAAISVEVWAVPEENFGSFVAGIPAPLGIGKIELADGRWVSGFICEPYGIEGADDITELADWRKHIEQMEAEV